MIRIEMFAINDSINIEMLNLLRIHYTETSKSIFKKGD